MLHPSPLALDYMFGRLLASHLAAATDPQEQELLAALASLHKGLAHRSSDPTSAAHQAFLRSLLETIRGLQMRHPNLALGEEEQRVRAALLALASGVDEKLGG